MDKAVCQWLSDLNITSPVAANLARNFSKSYTIYGHMLLLPPKTFEGSEWNDLKELGGDVQQLYLVIARCFHVSHIAINKPIPSHKEDSSDENVLRAPTNFNPLYGDFGPSTCSDPPTQADFTAGFWATTKQNGILQAWAPRWTMFSRGNFGEKTRLLTLPSVMDAVQQGDLAGTGSCAVDLYVGIGYFAFSYLKAGFSKVLGWDLNPWSIEGLRRGASANCWETTVLHAPAPGMEPLGNPDAKLIAFNESNEEAPARIAQLRSQLPPIRHVNCGLLPTSKSSWNAAVAILDPELGGWIHVHENMAVNEIHRIAQDILREFQMIVDRNRSLSMVILDSVNRVKTYVPGVMHCVLDIQILPH